MRLVMRLTTRTDDLPVPDLTEGDIIRLVDSVVIDTVTTSGGWAIYEQNGSPGPFRVNWNHAGVVKDQYSTVMGPSGPIDISAVPLVFRSFTDGVIAGVGGGLAVTATGSTMNIDVASGAALVKGIVYDHLDASSITIAPAPTSLLSRIDRLVVRVVPPDNTEEGRSELVLKQGVEGLIPVAPALTQTNEVWEISLATIFVGTDVIVIGSDKVTDTRAFSSPNIAAGGISTAMLADLAVTTAKLAGGAVTNAKLGINSVFGANLNDDIITQFMLQDDSVVSSKIAGNAVTTSKILAGGVWTANLADLAVTAAKLAANAVETAKINNLAVTEGKLSSAVQTKLNAASASASVLMPGTEFVATGPISSGSRTLVTMEVGPLLTGVTYAILVYVGVTLRNQVNTGTVIVRANINAGTQRTHEFQNVGGVPRWAPVTQTAAVVGAGGNINVTGSVVFNSGDPTDVRAGWIQAIALPLNVAIGS